MALSALIDIKGGSGRAVRRLEGGIGGTVARSGSGGGSPGWQWRRAPHKHTMVRVHRREERLRLPMMLGAADEKQPAGAQGEMENIERLALRFAGQVNEQVAAGDEIAARERGVLEQIVRGKKNLLPNSLAHPVMTVIAHEKFAQPLRRDVRFDCRKVKSFSRVGDWPARRCRSQKSEGSAAG